MPATPTNVTVSGLVGSNGVGLIFSNAIEWLGTVATTIVSNPILLVFTLIPLVGLGVGLFKRLINVN